MKPIKYFACHLIFQFILVFGLLSLNCNGQSNPASPETGSEVTNKNEDHNKLIRTLGTDVYAEVRCITEDHKGNLWFGTTGEGLYRYDGTLFHQFTKRDGLSSNIIYSLLTDNEGKIWIGTDSGLCIYNGILIARVTLPAAPVLSFSSGSFDNAPPYKNEVWSMMQDSHGTIWFGTHQGIYTFNGKTFSSFFENQSIINNNKLNLKMADYIIEDKNGNIWFASGMIPGSEGICRFNGSSVDNFKPDGDGWIRTMIEDQRGVIWFGTRKTGVWYFDPETDGILERSIKKYTDKTGLGSPLLCDHYGNVWFGGEEHDNGYNGIDGIWVLQGQNFINFNTSHGLGNYGVWCIFEDSKGIIWVGTRNMGLYRFDGKTFTAYSEE